MSVLTTTLDPARLAPRPDPLGADPLNPDPLDPDPLTADPLATGALTAGAAWTPVCPYDHLIPGRGVAALLDDGTQAAVFRTGADDLFAVGNLDPFSGACVISRGLTGARGGGPTIASPMYKHVFDLRTGECLDGPAGPQDAALPVYLVRCVDGLVYVLAPAQRSEEQP